MGSPVPWSRPPGTGYRACMTTPAAEAGPEPAHEVRVVDGRFAHAECSCGWRSAGRRDRRALRAEARDHALLYAEELAVPDVDVSETDVAADAEA